MVFPVGLPQNMTAEAGCGLVGKMLALQSRGPESDPQNRVKPDMVVCFSNLIAEDLETGSLGLTDQQA